MPAHRVTLFTKPGCHLCEAAEQVIAQVRERHPFELHIIDILLDPDAHARYKHDVPVVLLNGRELARHRLSREELERAVGG